MTSLWILLTAALADPRPVVALGAPDEAPEPTGWVAVLADCLEERIPGRLEVISRGSVREVRALEPALVIVGRSEQELAPGEPREVGDLVAELHREPPTPAVLVVALAPPTLSQAAVGEPAGEAPAGAAPEPDEPPVAHVSLVRAWPLEPEVRARLTHAALHLSEQGHARVAAQVCDAVVDWESEQRSP